MSNNGGISGNGLDPYSTYYNQNNITSNTNNNGTLTPNYNAANNKHYNSKNTILSMERDFDNSR